MEVSEAVRRAAEDHGKEAFFHHREEVYDAVRAVCFCGEFLQNQEDWGFRRAICMRRGCSQAHWEERFKEDYDWGLRREELRKLQKELGGQGPWMGKDVPLKNFLRQGVFFLAEEAGSLDGSREWLEMMETQLATDRYGDHRAFLEAVYVTGLWEIMKFQQGTNWHDILGDFRDREHLLAALRSLIPEEGREAYDRYQAGLVKEMEEKRVEAMKTILGERDLRLQRSREEKGGIPVLDRFQRAMEEMDDEGFKQYVRERFDDQGWEEDETLSPKLNGISRNAARVKNLAEPFVYADTKLKERLFLHLSKEEQKVAMEQWIAGYYPANVGTLAVRLGDMLRQVQTSEEDLWDWDEEGGCFFDRFDRIVGDSLEKITGRKVAWSELLVW